MPHKKKVLGEPRAPHACIHPTSIDGNLVDIIRPKGIQNRTQINENVSARHTAGTMAHKSFATMGPRLGMYSLSSCTVISVVNLKSAISPQKGTPYTKSHPKHAYDQQQTLDTH